MTITEDQEELLQQMISDLEARTKMLSDWERNFLADQIERYHKYGSETRLSPKQWAVLKKMHDKVTE